MIFNRVDREGHHFDIALLKLSHQRHDTRQLSGTHWGEVLWVGEQNTPSTTHPVLAVWENRIPHLQYTVHTPVTSLGKQNTPSTIHSTHSCYQSGKTEVAAYSTQIPRGGTIHRCIDIWRYFSRDTYRDIIFYNHDFFFLDFFFPQ